VNILHLSFNQLEHKTYLEYKSESEWVDFALSSMAESFYDDFREVNGVIIPFFIERTFSQRDRIMQIKKIEFNINADESLFVIPKSKEIEKLKFLDGKWDVKFYVSWQGRWYPMGNTVSEIKFAATNLLQEKIEQGIQHKIINYT